MFHNMAGTLNDVCKSYFTLGKTAKLQTKD